MSELQESYEALRLWEHPIVAAVIEQMKLENYADYVNADKDPDRLLRIKMKRECIDAFESQLEARTVDAMRDRMERDQ